MVSGILNAGPTIFMINMWCTTSCPRSLLNFHCSMLYFLPHCLHVTIKYNPVFFPWQLLPKPSTYTLADNKKSSTDLSRRCGQQNWTAQSRSYSETREKQCPIAALGRCVHSILCATRFILQSHANHFCKSTQGTSTYHRGYRASTAELCPPLTYSNLTWPEQPAQTSKLDLTVSWSCFE